MFPLEEASPQRDSRADAKLGQEKESLVIGLGIFTGDDEKLTLGILLYKNFQPLCISHRFREGFMHFPIGSEKKTLHPYTPISQAR